MRGCPYKFGPFLIDPVKRVLLKGETPVPLTAKALDVLVALIERRGQVLDKNELLRLVWPNTAVEENNLTQTISRIRKALHEKPNDHRYIVTIPGRGYSFVGEISESGAELDDWRPAVPSPPPKGNAITRTWRPAVALVALVVAVGAAILGWNEGRIPYPDDLRVTRFTTAGNVSKAAISPDGRYVAYAAGEPGEQSLLLRMVDTDAEFELAPSRDRYYLGLTFSPDGNHLYYVTRRGQSRTTLLHRVAVLGGREQLIKTGLASPISFSPDGSRFAFVREDRGQGESLLVLAEVSNENETVLASRKFPEFLDYPTWAPDGKSIACTVVRTPGGNVGLLEVGVKTKSERQMSPRSWRYIWQIAWLEDGSSILFSARDLSSEVSGIWSLSRHESEAQQIVESLDHWKGVSLTSDSRLLVTVQERLLSSVWVAPEGLTGPARQVRPDAANHSGVGWMPDGRVLYDDLGTEGRSDLWVMHSDGSGARRLTRGANNFNASMCPAKPYILFVSDRAGSLDIWRLKPEDGQIQKIVRNTGDTFPQCTPDGRWVVYTAMGEDGWPTLWKAPLQGGEPQQLNKGRALRPSVSQDGRQVACFYSDERASPQEPPGKLALIPIEGGDPAKLFRLPQTIDDHPGIKWTPNGRGLAYVDNRNGVSNIWVQPLDGKPPKQLSTFAGGRIFHFDWPAQGKPMVYTSGRLSRDVVLIRRQD